MIITETNIPDVTYETLDQSKLSLANGIINNVYPLFDEVYTSKNERVGELKDQITSNNRKLKAEKQTIETTMTEYKRQKRVSKLLQRLEKLVSSGLVYDGALKHETVILLKILPKLSNAQIDDHLRKTLQVIKKRFAK